MRAGIIVNVTRTDRRRHVSDRGLAKGHGCGGQCRSVATGEALVEFSTD
jgi:hypothetical protein